MVEKEIEHLMVLAVVLQIAVVEVGVERVGAMMDPCDMLLSLNELVSEETMARYVAAASEEHTDP